MKQTQLTSPLTCLSERYHVYIADMPNAEVVNPGLYKGFLNCMDETEIRRSHFFNGRYENIYVDAAKVPEVSVVLDQVMRWSEALHGHSTSSLKRGFWFNHILPGERTLSHTHDDNRELLSAVYYIRVPSNSGQLVLGSGSSPLIVEPREGMAVMFPPDLVHEVTVNNSNQPRLSIGINIGT